MIYCRRNQITYGEFSFILHAKQSSHHYIKVSRSRGSPIIYRQYGTFLKILSYEYNDCSGNQLDCYIACEWTFLQLMGVYRKFPGENKI